MPQLWKCPFLLSVYLLSTHTFGVFLVNLYWFVYWFEEHAFLNMSEASQSSRSSEIT